MAQAKQLTDPQTPAPTDRQQHKPAGGAAAYAAYREHVVLQQLRGAGAQFTLADSLAMGRGLHAEGQGWQASHISGVREAAAKAKGGWPLNTQASHYTTSCVQLGPRPVNLLTNMTMEAKNSD